MRMMPDRMRRLITALCLVFFVSGASGLMYESIWSRYLALFVGHSAYAQIVVLVIFMGGMSLGAIVAGRRSKAIKNPLFVYAAIEAIVGVIGIVFHGAYVSITDLAYDSIFPALSGSATLSIAKWGLASMLILPQSVLLGATFPLMTAGVLRLVRDQPGRVVSLLYFANSLGAALGVLLGGFYVIGLVGLPGTLTTAGILNLIVAATTIGIIGWQRRLETSESSASAPSETPVVGGGTPRLFRFMLIVAFGTAMASFIYEIAWIRMLSLVLGSATHAFELMLSAFILGIALGSFWVRSRADRFEDPLRVLGLVQWLMGFLALATLPIYLRSFEWTATLLDTFTRTDTGYTAFTLTRYAMCLAVMLPATFCAGITLPLVIRVLLADGVGERAVGAVYGVNTLGSIIGVAIAGLILMPILGLKWMLVAGAVVDMALGAYILYRGAPSRGPRRVAYGAVAATVVVAIVAGTTQEFSLHLMGSGVYRSGKLKQPGEREYLSYADGRTASIAVFRTRLGKLSLLTNGKPDATVVADWFTKCEAVTQRRPMDGDTSTQMLLPMTLLAHGPNARTAAVIGQGSGLSSSFLLASKQLQQLVTIEIEPEMIAASRLLYPSNRRVFDDPRSTFIIDDAKSYFAAANHRFDLILSEPSNPVVSGVSGLFTTEFYGRIRRYLSDDGVFGQWLHLYELNDDLVLSVLTAVHENFPSYRIYFTGGSDVIIVAGNRAELPAPDWSVFRSPEVERDLCMFVPFTPEALEATWIIDRVALAPLLDTFERVNSDYFPYLDLGSEKARFLGKTADGFLKLANDRFAIHGPISKHRIAPWSSEASPVISIQRLTALAIGTTLRQAEPSLSTSPEPLEVARRDRLSRYQLWKQSLDAPTAPLDWLASTHHALAMEELVNGGTAGAIDEGLFDAITRFHEKHDAPVEARAAIRFRHALATWNLAEAASVAQVLVPSAFRGVHWISPDELCNGIVISLLLLGQPDVARDLYGKLSPLLSTQSDDVRRRLLEAYLR